MYVLITISLIILNVRFIKKFFSIKIKIVKGKHLNTKIILLKATLYYPHF